MNILHTSDWHLGCSLHGHRRYSEHDGFLDWLIEIIRQRDIEILIVSGDIFDSSIPSNRALSQYYSFLHRISSTCCRHVFVTSGNHDSPSLLSAPRDLLKHLNVHVVASISENPEEEVTKVTDSNGNLQLIVAAIPYLKDRDIRTTKAGESMQEKAQNLVNGIIGHYYKICKFAESIRKKDPIPLVVTGHLFATGGRIEERDGERELYVGSLAHVPIDKFPPGIDYLALGHLHRTQRITGSTLCCYPGSPLPMSFNRSKNAQSVSLLSLSGKIVNQEFITVPTFKKMVSIKGNSLDIYSEIDRIKSDLKPAWVEIHYSGHEPIGNLPQKLYKTVSGSKVDILRIFNTLPSSQGLYQETQGEALDNLTPLEVFNRCLEKNEIPKEQHSVLLSSFKEIMQEIYEADPMDE